MPKNKKKNGIQDHTIKRFALTKEEFGQIEEVIFAKSVLKTLNQGLSYLIAVKQGVFEKRVGIDKAPANIKRDVHIDFEKQEIVAVDMPVKKEQQDSKNEMKGGGN